MPFAQHQELPVIIGFVKKIKTQTIRFLFVSHVFIYFSGLVSDLIMSLILYTHSNKTRFNRNALIHKKTENKWQKLW